MSNQREILHVDDDPQFTAIVAARLKQVGYSVTSRNDPAQAIETLLDNKIRVVLLDIQMPTVNGLEMLREIKRFDGGTQVLMLTGLLSTASVMQAFRQGADGCFFKPLTDMRPLLEAIEDSYRKIDRWWQTLRELSERKRKERAAVLS